MIGGAFVSPDWLAQRVDDPSVRIVESSIARATYDAAHIPGAQWTDFHRDLLINGDDSCGYVVTAEQYAALMRRLGIAPESTVVWYGDRHNSYAIRGFWMMDYYRHPGRVHVLEGGRERWEREGRPMTDAVAPAPEVEYPTPGEVNDANRATWQEVVDAIDDPDAVILDARAPDEHSGANRRAARGGHIPGAINIEWTDAAAGPNVLKPVEELRRMYEDAGITPDKRVIAHCQLGIRAAHSWFVLKHVLGYENVKNYDGSWQEWGNRDDLPIES